MTPAATRTVAVLLAGATVHVGSGPRGRTVSRRTARELIDQGLCDWTDYDNRGDRPGFETVSDVRLYMPTCDGCRKRFAPNVLRRFEDLALCGSCSVRIVGDAK